MEPKDALDYRQGSQDQILLERRAECGKVINMQKIKAIKLIFENDKALILEKREVKSFNAYGLCNNATIEEDHGFDLYQACQSYDLVCAKDLTNKIIDTTTRKMLPVRSLDFLRENAVIAIEVVLDANFGMRIYVPYDKNAVCQNVKELEDAILISGSVH